MPEKQLEQLPHGATPNSFRVLVEWLRENRVAVEKRLDSQDHVLSSIWQEVRRTNGRVTDLENTGKLKNALTDAERAWEQNEAMKVERKRRRRQRVVQAFIGGALVVLGGVASNLGHLLGLW